jgi:predicted RNA methylase
VDFDVLYYAKNKRYWDIVEEIGQKEGELIREYRPVLNTQIPKAEDWHKWEVNPVDAQEVLRLLLDE